MNTWVTTFLLAGAVGSGFSQHNSPSSAGQMRSEAQAVHSKMLKASKTIAASAGRIAAGEVSIKDMPNVFLAMCTQRCDARHFQCLTANLDPTIPDLSERPPKEFPIKIPTLDNTGNPEKTGVTPAKRPQLDCAGEQTRCKKQCDCQFLN